MEQSFAERVLPPLLDETTFDQALDAIVEIVGEDNVSRDSLKGNLEGPQGQTCYGDLWPLADPTHHTPSAAIRPASVQEIQGVLKIANHYKFPLWTVSRGKNLGYGASGSIVRGSVILDLHRMNKIIEVNEEYAYAIVEPGVSFFDLYEYVQEKGYRLWPSSPALGWGSVVGNTLERGFGYTPAGEHAEQQCGMELVLANGEVVRTGMGALKGSPMWPLYKGGYGPSVDGLFFQSNFGIVTKLGVHITPAPVCYIDCEVSVPNEEDLTALVKGISSLEREGVIQNHASIANPYRQAFSWSDAGIMQRVLTPGMHGNCATNEDMTALQREQGWGYWRAYFAIYGASAKCIDAHWCTVQERLHVIKGVAFKGKRHESKDGGRLNASKMPKGEIPHNGFPRMDAKDFVNVRGYGGGHIAFSPLFPPGGTELQAWFTKAHLVVEKAKFDLFSDFHVYGRYVIGIVLVVYGPNEGVRAKTLIEELIREGKDKFGISEYRTHIDYMDEVQSHFDFGNGSLHRLLTVIKQSLDPNGILSPGKSGIWASPLTPKL